VIMVVSSGWKNETPIIPVPQRPGTGTTSNTCLQQLCTAWGKR